MKNVLVTGAGGFIGHHLVSYLKLKGCSVIAVDRKFPEFEKSKADRFIIHDIRYPNPQWEELFDGVDEVYGLACDMGGMGFISKNHATIMRDNVLMNIHTLEAARKAKVKKYLFTSSACVYPDFLQTKQEASSLSESQSHPANPPEGYGWEKLYTEKMCESYYHEYGMDVRIVRLHNIYGPLGTWQGGREKAPAAISRKIAEAIRNHHDFIEIWGDGKQTRSFCYIDDCIKGFELIMNATYNGPINLGRDEMVNIDELADRLMRIAGVELKKVYVQGPQGVRGRNADTSLLKELTGWAPAISLTEGLDKTYRWVREQVARDSR